MNRYSYQTQSRYSHQTQGCYSYQTQSLLTLASRGATVFQTQVNKVCLRLQVAALRGGGGGDVAADVRHGGAVQVDSIKTRVESAPGFSS